MRLRRACRSASSIASKRSTLAARSRCQRFRRFAASGFSATPPSVGSSRYAPAISSSHRVWTGSARNGWASEVLSSASQVQGGRPASRHTGVSSAAITSASRAAPSCWNTARAACARGCISGTPGQPWKKRAAARNRRRPTRNWCTCSTRLAVWAGACGHASSLALGNRCRSEARTTACHPCPTVASAGSSIDAARAGAPMASPRASLSPRSAFDRTSIHRPCCRAQRRAVCSTTCGVPSTSSISSSHTGSRCSPATM